jgi:hypothetical protein
LISDNSVMGRQRPDSREIDGGTLRQDDEGGRLRILFRADQRLLTV